MALLSANYAFMYVDVGAEGHQSYSGILRECSMKKFLDKSQVKLPISRNLPHSNMPCEFVIMGTDAIPLDPHLLKLFCQ